MKRSNRLVILVGVLLAVLAFVAIVILLNNQQAAQNAEPDKAAVLVASTDIAIGDPVTPDKVEALEVPLAAAPGLNVLTDPSQVAGQPALVAIPAGSQITEEAVGLGDSVQSISAQLKVGEKAIAVQVDQVTGLNFLIQPGDHVDIVVAAQLPATLGAPGDSFRTVKTVIQDRRVLYVSGTRLAGPVATVPPEGDVSSGAVEVPLENIVVVVAGTDQDAEIIRYAQRDALDFQANQSATVSLTLRAPGDAEVETTLGGTIELLIEEFGLPIPDLSANPLLQPQSQSQTPTE